MRMLNHQKRRQPARTIPMLPQNRISTVYEFRTQCGLAKAFGVGVRCVLASLFLCAIPVYAADAPFNSATISGLGRTQYRLRHHERPRRRASPPIANRPANSRSLSARPAAAFGNRKTVARIIGRSSMNNRCNRSARSRSIRRTRRTSGSARVNRGSAIASRLATAFTNQPTAERPGTSRACQTRNAFRRSSLVRRAATRFMRRSRARSGAIRPIAVFTRRPTAARPGARFSKVSNLSTARRPSRWIRRTRTSSSPGSGISGAKAGPIVPAAKRLTILPAVGSFARPTAAPPGRKSLRKQTKVFRRNPTAEWRSQSRLRIQSGSIALSNQPTARFSFPTTAADLGATRQEPVDGLAPVLLCEPHRRPEKSQPRLQD